VVGGRWRYDGDTSAAGGGSRRLVVAVLTMALALAVATPAAAGEYDDPFFLNWPTFLPAVEGEYVGSTERDCPTGSNRCVDQVIREMTRRYNALGCHHDGTFAFTYLLTTEEYRRAVEDPDFFEDNAFVNHQDVVFADHYFQQHDDWSRGRLERVSPAWRVAFHAAQEEQVTGMGNVLLGMNAHVNRDLPFVLYAIGLTKPDGSSRKADHDRVNDFLNEVNKYLLDEAAKYHDPTINDGDVPGTTIDNSTMVQLLTSWREAAWRNAERLAAAGSESERLAVAQQIEDAAAMTALTLRESYRYGLTHALLRTDAKARNAFCHANWVER
jgi:hypothetical protein